MKIKKVGNVDLPAWCFAYVPDEKQPHLWKLPIHHPSKQKELNLVLAAVERFRDVKIPDAAARAGVWKLITKQAYKHNVSFPAKMPALKRKSAPPQTQQQSAAHQQKLTVETLAQKQARAEADYRAEAFLKSIGFWSDEHEDN